MLIVFVFSERMDGLTSSGPKKLIYVGGLAEEVDQKVLNAAFIPFGDIIEVDNIANLNRLYHCPIF